MKNTIITDNLITDIKSSSLALGFFDGLHQGHKKVLHDAVELSKKLGTQSVVLTFKNHPIELLYGVQPEFITTYEERIELFEKLGFDVIIIPEFTKEIAQMSANDYFEKILLKLNPKSISIGYNHKFGAKQSGDSELLLKFAKECDFILDIISPVKCKNEVTSSTLIRNLIKQGDVEKAYQLLEKPYSVKNIVIKGAQRGRELNFPTANIFFPEKKIIPKFGVYAGVLVFEGKQYQAIANVGLRPTFGDIDVPLIEIHILNFNNNIYGKMVEFKFLYKIRDEIKFTSKEALIEQISADIKCMKN